jgi:hypothetical protein
MAQTETVAQACASYLAAVLPPDAGPVQREETRRAFYAGTYFLLMYLSQAFTDDTPDEDGVAQLEALKAECEAFAVSVTNDAPQAPAPLVAPDISYTTPDADQFRPLLQELGGRIGSQLPGGWGFTLLLFQFGGPGGSLFYIANAQREDVIATMREFIRRQVS